MRWGVALRPLDPRLLLIPVTIAASAGDVRFAPPEGQRFRHLIVQEREDGGVRRRFTTERIIAFHKGANGYVAEVTITRNTAAAGQSGTAFVGAADALKGRTIRLNLDAAGKLQSIDDEAAIWDALNRAIAAIGQGGAARKAIVTDQTAPLRSLPPHRQRALIASLIDPLVAGPIATEGDHPIALPAGAIDGAPMLLAGRENVQRRADGMVLVETTASGTFPSPPGGGEGGHIAVTIRRTIDPRTGLVLASSETRDSWIGEKRNALHGIARTSSSLLPLETS